MPFSSSSIGAGIVGLAFCVFIVNSYESARTRPAGPNPWAAHTLEWATSSPSPRFNFNLAYSVPRVHSYAPLLDARERAQARGMTAGSGQAVSSAYRGCCDGGGGSLTGSGSEHDGGVGQ